MITSLNRIRNSLCAVGESVADVMEVLAPLRSGSAFAKVVQLTVHPANLPRLPVTDSAGVFNRLVNCGPNGYVAALIAMLLRSWS